MTLDQLYDIGVWTVLGLALVIFLILLFITAPYGRHNRAGWGPQVDSTLGWVVMESPAVLVFAYVFFRGEQSLQMVPLLLFLVWQAHYVQRTYVFPFLMRMKGKRTPLFTVALALIFNTVNATLNAYAISHGPLRLDSSWLTDPRFIIGVLVFAAGYVINRQSDAILRGLRAPGEKGYKIPTGGFFRWVSSPNYLGELIEWCGWALASWSLAGVAFLAFTFANLAPRALSNHKWYLSKFPDYPQNRRALIPNIF